MTVYLLKSGKPREIWKNPPTDIHVLERRDEDVAKTDDLWVDVQRAARDVSKGICDKKTYVLMAQMLEQLELAVCALGEDGRAEGLHDLLDRNGRSGELILGRTDI